MRAHDDLVVDVRDVHHVEQHVPKVLEQHTAHYVKADVVARVAEVCGVVDGGTARIPLDAALVHRLEPLRAAGEGVEQLETLRGCRPKRRCRDSLRPCLSHGEVGAAAEERGRAVPHGKPQRAPAAREKHQQKSGRREGKPKAAAAAHARRASSALPLRARGASSTLESIYTSSM